jgi:4a-hydroxytetrahydrobiopterin dehydratase
MKYTMVSAEEFATLDGVEDWRYVLSTIQATFRTGSFSEAADLVVAIAHAADTADHHPDIDVRYSCDWRVDHARR